ncbi:MAG: response regulator [Myxococcaceae bacterium]|nr:response regulator [Myxococcaceae bacterium]
MAPRAPNQMTHDELVAEVTASRSRHSDADLELLADVGSVLAQPLHHADTLSAMTRLVVPALADLCFVDVILPDGATERVAASFASLDKQLELGDQLESTVALAAASPQARVIATRQPERAAQVSRETIDSMAPDAGLEAMRRAGITSVMIVPLVARGRMLGALTFARTGASPSYTAEDLTFAEELGRRAAMHLDNARLLELHQRAIETRQELLALVSHDLKNPLSVITLNARALAGPPRAVERILHAAARMNGLVDDLLDAGSIESGHFSIEESRPVDAAAQVTSAVDALRSVAREKGVELELMLPAIGAVRADPARLQQVLSNLLGNALKFTPAGGKVSVHARVEGGFVEVNVSDTGPGLASETLGHIFDRYWQAEKSRRGGAGLGLFIVQGLIDAMGGRVWAENLPTGGSRFTFTLPRTTEPVRRALEVPVALRDAPEALHLRLPAHALRSALTTLELQLSRLHRENDLGDAQERALRHLSAATRRLSHMADAALRHALEAQAAVRPPPQGVDLRALAAAVVASLQADAQSRQLELTFVAPDGVLELQTDRELMGLALEALVVHAAKALRAGSVRVRLAADTAMCLIEVQGAGEMLEPARDSGLELASRTVAMLGGHLDVAEAGHTWVMRFRRQTVPPVYRADRFGRERARMPLLLVVEDDTEVREELTSVLRDEGYAVEAVRGGAEALKTTHLHNARPDLILLDLNMPGLSGRQFRAAQLEDPLLATVPVMVLSGDGDVPRAAREMGAAAFVTKPFQVDALIAKVNSLVRRS